MRAVFRYHRQVPTMMIRRTGAYLAVAGATVVATASADFAGKASFGYQGTSGNAETTSVNAATELAWEYKRWTHTVSASAFGADEDGQTTAEAYNLSGQSDFSLSDASYLFGRLNWDKDKFSGYDQQTTETIGYGRKLIDTDVQAWNVELGAGARQSELRDGTSENETVVRGATDYRYRLSETSEFNASLSVEAGDENTLAQSALRIKAQLVGELALVASYRVRYNSDVPVGSEKRDTFTAVSLEYAF